MKTKNALSILIASMLSFSCASMGTGVSTKVAQTETMEESMREVAKDLASLHDEIQIAYATEAAAAGFASLKSHPESLTITQKGAAIMKGADFNSGVLTSASFGQSFRVVDKVESWYAVQLEKPKSGIYSGWVSAKAAVPLLAVGLKESITDRLYQKIVSKVVAFRQKWEKNQYLKVSGFSIDISIPPSVSIDFEFK